MKGKRWFAAIGCVLLCILTFSVVWASGVDNNLCAYISGLDYDTSNASYYLETGD